VFRGVGRGVNEPATRRSRQASARRLLPRHQAGSGAMVPAVMRDDQIVGNLLLLRGQAGIERLERCQQAGIVFSPDLRELLAQS